MPAHTIDVLLDEPIGTIRPELYGQFAEHLGGCIYGGLWVGRDSTIPNEDGLRRDVLDALRNLDVPVLRWPGGCYADDYHWEDGIGPERPRRFNAWWGHDVEDNSFGTHEFLSLCEKLGAKPYLAGNVGSGTPREMKQWMEYCCFDGGTTLVGRRRANGRGNPWAVPYWGVGNESWGCGGNMCPEDYAVLYKRFATYLTTLGRAPTNLPMFLVACGPNGNDLEWTRRFFTKAGRPGGDWRLHGYGAHFYAGTAGTATEYGVDQWYQLLHRGTYVETLIRQQRAVMDEFDPDREIGLMIDEWGTWHPPTPGTPANHLWQQNTLRDALLAAMTLNTFNCHADQLAMANIAQVVNVLQAMILTRNDQMILTPTYHVFEMYKPHQGGRAVKLHVQTRPIGFVVNDERRELPAVSASASVKGHQLTLTIVNAHATQPAEVELRLPESTVGSSAVVLTHEDITAHNTFDATEVVRPGPLISHGKTLELPPASVTRWQATI